MVFRGSVSIDAAPTGKPKGLGQTWFYTDTVEKRNRTDLSPVGAISVTSKRHGISAGMLS